MTQEELRSCRTYSFRIASLNDSIERLRSTMESTTQVISSTPQGGGSNDKLAGQIAELIELVEKRNAEVIRLERLRTDVEAWLCTLPEGQAKVMRLRYVKCLPWRVVAKRTNYSIDHCMTINRNALGKLDG